MRTLEDRLTQASNEARHQVDQIDFRPASAIGRRTQRRRALVGAAAVALMFGAFSATALFIGNETESEFAAGGTAEAPTTTVVPATDDVVATPVPVTQSETAQLPRLRLTDDDNWAVMEAIDAGTGTTLIYEANPAIYGGEAVEKRLSIEVWSDIPGDEAGSGYHYALENILLNEESLADAGSGVGNTAKSFTFTDPNTGISGFYFLWQHSDTVAVEVIVYVDSFEQATAALSLIERIKDSDWDEILAGRGLDQGVTSTTVAHSG